MRHGQTEFNVKGLLNGEIDEPLTAEGLKQAELTASNLPKRISHIYASPLLRARQTTEIVAGRLNVPVTFHPELVEVRYGAFAGSSWEVVGEERHRQYRTLVYDFRSFGGSEAQEDREKIGAFLTGVLGDGYDYPLAVTSGGIMLHLHALDRGDFIGEGIGNANLEEYNVERMLDNINMLRY